MIKFQFRVNVFGKVILQRSYKHYDPQLQQTTTVYEDADVTDLKYYYEQFLPLQKPCACQEQRCLFDAECS